MAVVTAAFTAAAQSSGILVPRFGPSYDCYFNVSVAGTFVGTVGLYRNLPGDSAGTWRLMQTFTAPTETFLLNPECGTSYQMQCSAYTSGTINIRLGQTI